jgi:imidazolonepropionase-like amidohydrolase
LSLLKSAICTAALSAGLTLYGAVPSAIAIKDAHVVTVSGEDMPKATILLRDGLIQDVGTQVNIPADTWVIEGAGLTVYPGFVNALSNWGLPSATASTTNRAATPTQTTSAEPRVHGPEDRPQNYSYERAADSVSPSDTKLEAARAAGFTSSATFLDRGIFRGLGAYIDLAGEKSRDMIVAEPIAQQISITRTAGFGRAFPSALMGYLSYVRQMFLDLGQYQEAKSLYAANPVGQRRPEYDHTLEGLAESPRLLLPAVESQQIERMLQFAPELRKPYLLYGLHEGFKDVDLLKKANVPLLVSLKWPEKPANADPANVPNYRDLVLREQAPTVPGMLAKAGVKFAFYSDGVDSAADLKKALKKAIDAGLTRADAVRALTLTPAEYYGVADRTGSIAKGKIANLVIMKGEAFDDKTTVEYVFVDGIQFKPSKESQQPRPGGGRRPGSPAPDDDDNTADMNGAKL